MISAQELRQKVTVRVRSNDDGTGVLFFPKELNVAYVFTARHVVFALNETSFVRKPGIVIDNFFPYGGVAHSYLLKDTDPVFFLENIDDDLAVIIINREDVPFLEQLEMQLASTGLPGYAGGLRYCTIRGFAGFSDSISASEISCSFKEYLPGNDGTFLIKSTENLNTLISRANENVAGMSGSGVFVMEDGNSYLLGIVKEFTDIDTFCCVSAARIVSLLLQNGYPSLQFYTIFEPGLKAAVSTFQKNNHTVLARVRDTIGTVHLERGNIDSIRQQASANVLTVFRGPSGTGKSALAKQIVSDVLDGSEVLMFTGEQFSKGTITQVFQALGIQLSVGEILENPVLKKQKIFWIDSTEKTLDSDENGALNELLSLSKSHPEIKIILTLRNYAYEQFLLQFAWVLPEQKKVIDVPLLDQTELDIIKGKYPAATGLLENPKLADLLKTPFYLKFAIDLLPVLGGMTELDEAKLRKVIWEYVIEKKDQKRSRAFEDLSVKRATELSLYTTIVADSSVITGLFQDSLIVVEDDELRERYAPAHDVLEDWALVRYIWRNKKTAGSPSGFFQDIGNGPAIRRAFRLWTSEALQSPDGPLNEFVQDVLTSTLIEPFWKDEILIAVLQSKYSEHFFAENEKLLLDGGASLVFKLIHLLRTACKETNTDPKSDAFPLLVGQGWESMVIFLYKHRKRFHLSDHGILSFLIEWQAKMYTGGFHFPVESRTVGLYLLDILGRLKLSYRGSYNRSATDTHVDMAIGLLLSLAKVIQKEITAFLEEAENGRDRDHESPDYYQISFYEKVIDITVTGVSSIQLAMYLPDTLINILKRYVFLEEETGKNGNQPLERDEPEQDFGLVYHYGYIFYPASSYQTPLYWLLQNHLVKSLEFIVETINKTTAKYISSPRSRYEKVVQIVLTLNDGTSARQWGSPLLWSMYRGHPATPSFLQSILMALEKYLIDICEKANGKLVHGIFDYFYKRSSSISTTAVLTSVALKYPSIVGDRILPLYTSRYIFSWEQDRYMTEISLDVIGTGGANAMHEKERRESNALPHRKSDPRALATLMVDQQINDASLSPEIFKILDNYQQAPMQSDDILWQKTLSEIDVRTWEVKQSESNLRQVILSPKYNKAVSDFLQKDPKVLAGENIEIIFSGWVNDAYKENQENVYSLEKWREIYTYYSNQPIIEPLFFKPVMFSVTGLRDFNGRLNEAEKKWCMEKIFNLAESLIAERRFSPYPKHISPYNQLEVRPCLEFIPKLFRYVTEEEAIAVKKLIIELLSFQLHPHESNTFLQSFRDNIWTYQRGFGNSCFSFLIAWGNLEDENRGWLNSFGQHKESEKENSLKELMGAAINGSLQTDISTLRLSHISHYYYYKAFALFPPDISDLVAINFCKELVRLHLLDFSRDRLRQGDFAYFTDRKNIAVLLSVMLLEQPTEISAAIIDLLFIEYSADKSTNFGFNRATGKQEFIEDMVRQIIFALDNLIGTASEHAAIQHFWQIWCRLHQKNIAENSHYFASLLLLHIDWKETALHWKPLEGHVDLVMELIKYYGPKYIDSALYLLASIGDQTLMPGSISTVAGILGNLNPPRYFLNTRNGNRFAKNAFFKYRKQIKQSQQLLKDYIFILDHMINMGSADAYLIRENMITYKA